MNKYLEMCDTEELKNSLSDSETPQQYALSELPWNPVFRQKLLVIALATHNCFIDTSCNRVISHFWAQILARILKFCCSKLSCHT